MIGNNLLGSSVGTQHQRGGRKDNAKKKEGRAAGPWRRRRRRRRGRKSSSAEQQQQQQQGSSGLAPPAAAERAQQYGVPLAPAHATVAPVPLGLPAVIVASGSGGGGGGGGHTSIAGASGGPQPAQWRRGGHGALSTTHARSREVGACVCVEKGDKTNQSPPAAAPTNHDLSVIIHFIR